MRDHDDLTQYDNDYIQSWLKTVTENQAYLEPGAAAGTLVGAHMDHYLNLGYRKKRLTAELTRRGLLVP